MSGRAPSGQALVASGGAASVSTKGFDPSRLEALMQELGDLWYGYVCQDHHKDRDCHFSITAMFSYGGAASWSAEHNGYVAEFPRNKRTFARPEWPTYELALADCIRETFELFRRHYGNLHTSTVERLKVLSAKFAEYNASGMEARQGGDVEQAPSARTTARPDAQGEQQ